jgi:septal ring factor EnvC (AmiA/AmiB activator)
MLQLLEFLQTVATATARRAVILAVALALPGAFSSRLAAQGSDRARIEAQARRAAERLQALNEEADRLAREARTLIGDLRKLEIERQIRTEELRRAEEATADAAAELARVDEDVRRLEQAQQAERPALHSRIVELYKLGGGRYVRLLLSTADAQRIGQASRTIAALAKRDRDRILMYQRRLAHLTASRQALQVRSKELAAGRAAAERARGAADRAVQARNALIRDIDARRDLTAQLSGELVSAQQRLQTQLQNLSGATVVAPLPLRPFRGDLDWPARGALRQRFGGVTAPARAASNGIEIAVGEGTTVKAVHDGTVAFASSFAGFGNLVIVEHGAQTFSLYGNLLDMAVSRGAQVDRGTVVGTAGASVIGAPGLYFELRVDGRPVDPLQWLKR